MLVPEEELAARRQQWKAPALKHTRGTLYKYSKYVPLVALGRRGRWLDRGPLRSDCIIYQDEATAGRERSTRRLTEDIANIDSYKMRATDASPTLDGPMARRPVPGATAARIIAAAGRLSWLGCDSYRLVGTNPLFTKSISHLHHRKHFYAERSTALLTFGSTSTTVIVHTTPHHITSRESKARSHGELLPDYTTLTTTFHNGQRSP